ncbi:type IV inositol polyphosphate 5-phosphatase 9-like isoform X1 [Salvia miltiorrhiza]|uniref:type IV inositol polyphosphate 5-phosphatase 9-like isoform X1 n=1 Tax=Salvia miltiorrhiza TaxID=226208 RepID=UPI0025ACB75B|nr:type IV inositol polyphosphate 5-phosphatase 9-like isoform X1 [Salvia miltiorrhiza]
MVAELIMEASNILRKRVVDDSFIPHFGNMPETSAQNSNQAYFSSQEYCIPQGSFEVFVGSWNVGGIRPPDNLNLDKWLSTQDTMADIYVLGFQEIVPLTAGNILAAENSDISKHWNSLIKAALNKRTLTEDTLQKTEVGESQRIYPLRTQSSIKSNATDYKCIINKQMVGIYITMWARTDLHQYISNLGVSCVGCGILGRLGNKGSVSIRFCLHETSFCFVCSHLASGGKEGDERHRNADAAHILARTLFPPEPLQHLPRKILDHDRVIWLGDLNYRIHLPEDTTRSLVKNKEWSLLLKNDQLRAEMNKGRVFEEWHEELIEFAPTYKYDRNSDDYYGSDHKIKVKRMRAPAWCDRIIWFGKGLKQIQYNRVESRLSDHRPVYARFTAYVEVSKLPGMQGSNLSSRTADSETNLYLSKSE